VSAQQRVASAIKWQRTVRGMRQFDLAVAVTAQLGRPFKSKTLSKIETLDREIRVDELECIADIFGVPVGSLFNADQIDGRSFR
jgi:transcriptional regulator with XRE-family HTH domain